jgi:hypothetical protein
MCLEKFMVSIVRRERCEDWSNGIMEYWSDGFWNVRGPVGCPTLQHSNAPSLQLRTFAHEFF